MYPWYSLLTGDHITDSIMDQILLQPVLVYELGLSFNYTTKQSTYQIKSKFVYYPEVAPLGFLSFDNNLIAIPPEDKNSENTILNIKGNKINKFYRKYKIPPK